jgi:prepilin-type N-terminal cleavage/methylation domain-containing protein
VRRAFTLIEVITVLLIVTITASVGYHVLTTASNGSYTQIQQGYATQVVTAEDNFFTQYGVFTPYPSDLTGISLPVTAITGPVTGPDQVAIAVGATSGDVALAYDDGTHACLVSPPQIATTTSTSTTSTTIAPSTPCTASLALVGESALTTVPLGTAK